MRAKTKEKPLPDTETRPLRDADSRPLRADAQRNHEQIIAAADAAFREQGADASLEEIARRAGVGIGTLYRRFPTREDLLAAILDKGTVAIVARGEELLTAKSPKEGLTQWLEALAQHVTRYRGLTGRLAEAYGAKGQPLCVTCDLISCMGEQLVRRAQKAGELSGDALPQDIILAAHAAAWVGEQSKDAGAPGRLLATVIAGHSKRVSRR
ncbi:MAG TPA: helix-turn-helix domain-containing protein [Myxococcales bacterium]|jgi:AcrR family transcriptional regulator|nr:helix-turn-helix domain-containing protein [Myxococcales bacterium]